MLFVIQWSQNHSHLVDEVGRQAAAAAARAHFELMVTLDEAVVNEGDGQRQQHNTAHHAEAAKHTARHRNWVHVSVSHRCHGDDDPPAGSRDTGIVLVSGLQVQTMLQQLG